MRFQIFYPLVRPPVQAAAKVRLACSVVTTHAAITTCSSRIVLGLKVSFHCRVDCASRRKRSARVLWIHAALLHQLERFVRTDAGNSGPLRNDELVILPDGAFQQSLVESIDVAC